MNLQLFYREVMNTKALHTPFNEMVLAYKVIQELKKKIQHEEGNVEGAYEAWAKARFEREVEKYKAAGKPIPESVKRFLDGNGGSSKNGIPSNSK